MVLNKELTWYKHPDESHDADPAVAQYRMEAALLYAVIFGGARQYRLAANHITADDFTVPEARDAWVYIQKTVDVGNPIDHKALRFIFRHSAKGAALFRVLMDDPSVQYVNAEGVAIDMVESTARRKAFDVANVFVDEVESLDDPHSAVQNARDGLDRLGREISTTEARPIADSIHALLDDLEKNEPYKAVTGILALDNYLGGGVRPGSVVTIAARSGDGKTSLALQSALETAAEGGHVCYFSYEMSAKELSARAVAYVADLNPESLFHRDSWRPDLMPTVDAAYNDLDRYALRIFDDAKIGIERLRSDVFRYHAERPVDLVVIDYLGIMPLPGQERDNKADRIGTVTKGAKQLAMQLNCVVMVLSQINREGAKSDKLSKAHLRDSSSIENDSDQIWLIQSDKKGHHIEIAKYRQGKTTNIPVTFVAERTKFEGGSF